MGRLVRILGGFIRRRRNARHEEHFDTVCVNNTTTLTYGHLPKC